MENKKLYAQLDKIQNGKEWKDLVEKYNNKAENIEQKILAEIEAWEQDKEVKYSEDDFLTQAINAHKEIIEDVEKIKGLEPLVEQLNNNIKDWKQRIINSLTSADWTPLSVNKYTKKEYELRKASEYRVIDVRLTWVKNSYAEQEWDEIDDEVYED